jgi:transcriptional regulator with XRE-family HTH domain
MAMNLALKMAILQSGKSQQGLAHELGMADSLLSKFVRGWRQPSWEQQRAIAKALRTKVDHLFAEVA